MAILKRLDLVDYVSDDLEEAWLSGTCEWREEAWLSGICERQS